MALHPPKQKNAVVTPAAAAAAGVLAGGHVNGNLHVTGELEVTGTTVLQTTTSVAGVAKFAEGAVGAPSITFASDLTSGLYHTGTGATGSILAAINGVNKLVLTEIGLGLGIPTPAVTLDIGGILKVRRAADADNFARGITIAPAAYDGGCRITSYHSQGGTLTVGAMNTANGAIVSSLVFSPTTDSSYFSFNVANGVAAVERMRITSGGNLCIGATDAGASAAGALVLSNTATAPSASANLAHLYGADIAAGRATLATWSEEAPAADVGLASTHSYIEFINGAKYKRMLVGVA
jgi:hypothetical protein